MRPVSEVLILVVVTTVIALPYNQKPSYNLQEAPELFEEFINKYDRHYKDLLDKYKHFQAFVVTLVEINRLNKENPTATFGVNKFADYTEEEKKKLFGIG